MSALLVLVPCRNEALVIERKLRNLAWCEWPPADGPHRVLVIDDHSSDGTAALAAAAAGELFAGREDVRVEVHANLVRPGKSGAISTGLERRGAEALVVLTDADVLFEQAALAQLAAAFRDPRLGMGSGSQRFVEALSGDGRAASEGPLGGPAAGTYDRLTARIRALESEAGALVSVHGQLLAWRAELGLAPTPGMAADDLDLMLQVRATGARVERIPGAVFLERKTPAGSAREAQALRRARAYVQFLGHPRIGELTRGGPFRALQGCCYRWLPTAVPWLLPGLALVTCGVLGWLLGPLAAALGLALGAGALALPLGRRLVGLLRVIARAHRRESTEDLSDVWETAR